MIVTYRNASLSSPSAYSELDTQLLVHPCEVEEADQDLVRHTLNLIENGYKNILVCAIDTDVLVLLISYIGKVKLNDIESHSYLGKYYNIRQILQELGSDIFLVFFLFFLPFFYVFTGCDAVSRFYGKCKCKAYDV